MACTKRQLVEAINSYAAACVTGDGNLINMSAQLLQTAIDSLEFAEEEAVAEEAEAVRLAEEARRVKAVFFIPALLLARSFRDCCTSHR